MSYVDLKIHLNGIILEALFQDDVQTAHFAYNFESKKDLVGFNSIYMV